jgi:hypothetical protein
MLTQSSSILSQSIAIPNFPVVTLSARAGTGNQPIPVPTLLR